MYAAETVSLALNPLVSRVRTPALRVDTVWGVPTQRKCTDVLHCIQRYGIRDGTQLMYAYDMCDMVSCLYAVPCMAMLAGCFVCVIMAQCVIWWERHLTIVYAAPTCIVSSLT